MMRPGNGMGSRTAPYRRGGDAVLLGHVQHRDRSLLALDGNFDRGRCLSHVGTGGDRATLSRLAAQNTPTRVIGLKLGRTPDAVYAKASELGVSLAPTNQSPYNRRRR